MELIIESLERIYVRKAWDKLGAKF